MFFRILFPCIPSPRSCVTASDKNHSRTTTIASKMRPPVVSLPLTSGATASHIRWKALGKILAVILCSVVFILFCIVLPTYLFPNACTAIISVCSTIIYSIWRAVCWTGWLGFKAPIWAFKALVFLPSFAYNNSLALMSAFKRTWVKNTIAIGVFLATLVGQVIMPFVWFSLMVKPRRTYAHNSSPVNPNHCIICYKNLKKSTKKAKFSHFCNQQPICHNCLRKNIKQNLGSAGVDDRFSFCPANCGKKLTVSDLRDNHVPEEIVTKFQHFLMHRNDSMIQCDECKTENYYNYQKTFGKNSSAQIRCTSCATYITIRQDENLLKISKPKGWKACPGCGEMVERISGCNNMHHVKCGAMWCYPCGQLKSAHPSRSVCSK